MMGKCSLRKQYLDRRLAIGDEMYGHLSQKMADCFLSTFDLSAICYLHTFLPIIGMKEPNTWLIIDKIQERYSHIHIVISRIAGQNLIHYEYEGRLQITTQKWNIPQPKYGHEVSVRRINLVLVPLLVADCNGNRVGYGKGYYDRFLACCGSTTKKIGLSMLPLAEEIIEHGSFDVRIDGCVTPMGYFSFDRGTGLF